MQSFKSHGYKVEVFEYRGQRSPGDSDASLASSVSSLFSEKDLECELPKSPNL
jgi:hypothetical protein